LEVTPNVFLCCLKPVGEPIQTFEISPRRNDIGKLVDCFESGRYVFVGYNCSGYDTPIMNMLIMNKFKFLYADYLQCASAAFELSTAIISKGDDSKLSFKQYLYANLFKQIDLMTLMASQALRVGLKSLQVTMCMPNVKEMIIDWTKFLRKDQVDDLIFYCHNDVNSTSELLTLLKTDLALRIAVKQEFGIECLSKDGVGVGVDVFTKYVCEELRCGPRDLYSKVDVDDVIAVGDLILPDIKFKTTKFNDLLTWFKSRVVNLPEWEKMTKEEKKKDNRYRKTVVFNNLAHAYGLGGLHSVNKPMIYEEDDEYYYSDQDVESYYPSLTIKKGFGPRGFRRAFQKVMTRIKAERVEAKNAGNKVKDVAFKLSMNSILGNLKNKYSAFYDPAANMAIAINGQLYLTILIEECELNGIECISSNTDGATFKVPKRSKDLFDNICKEWCQKTEFKLEEALYEKIVILAVNDYIAFKKGYSEIKDQVDFYVPEKAISFNFVDLKLQGDKMNELRNSYVKEKGDFITSPRLGKGMDSLIVPKALQNFYGKGIPIEETIRDFRSIHDYMKMEKVGKQFNVEYGGEPQQHINRFYVSKSKPYLMKWKLKEKTERVGKGKSAFTRILRDKDTGEPLMEKSYTNLLSGYGVQLANDLTQENEYEINYQYYISATQALIDKLDPPQLTLF